MKRYCAKCAGLMIITDRLSQTNKKVWRCAVCTTSTVRPLTHPPTIIKDLDEDRLAKKTRYLITSALNNTEIDKGFWQTLRLAAQSLRAQLIVIPTYFMSPQMREEGAEVAYYWPKECKNYLAPNDVLIGEHLRIKGSVRISHTAINPLQGLNHAGGKKSEIFGHAQVAMNLVPMPHGKIPKLLHTTGTVSKPNYGPTWSSQKAAFHHSYCALFVETEDDSFWFTQVHYDGFGAFVYDKYFSPKGQAVRPFRTEAVVLGDLHVRFLTPETSANIDKIISTFRPLRTIYHDAHDHHLGSHHNSNNTLFNLDKNNSGEFSVRDELMMLVDYFNSTDRKSTGEMILVDSNHHRHLDQWFNRFDPRKDPVNVDLYFEIGNLVRLDLKKGGDGNPLRVFLQAYCKKELTFVGPNDNMIVRSVDLGQHGDIGPNGARGSAKVFARTGQKCIIGHGHTPCIEKGSTQVGVSGRAPYAKGYSSWLTSHVVLAGNGKRLFVNTINDKLPPILRR